MVVVERDRVADAIRSFADATDDPARLVQKIADAIAEMFDGVCAVAIVGGTAMQRVARAVPPNASVSELLLIEELADTSFRIDDQVVTRVVRNGTPIAMQLTEAQLRGRYPSTAQYAAAKALGVSQLMLVPLRARGTATGCVKIMRYGARSQPFSAGDLAVASQLADHAALALLDAQLLAELAHELAERRVVEARQQTLMELAREFSATTGDHQALLDLITQRFAEIVGDGCVIRYRADGEAMVGSVYHPDPAKRAHAVTLFGSNTHMIGAGLAGEAVRSGLPVRAYEHEVEILAARLPEPMSTWTRGLEIHSVMAVPLVSDGQTLAVATLWRSTDSPFSLDDERLIQAVASHAVLALANARLFAEIQRELCERTRMQQRASILSKVSRELSAATADSTQLLQIAARHFGEIIGDACVIRLVTADGMALADTGAVWHIDQEMIDALRASMLGYKQRAGDGWAGKVLVDGKLVSICAPCEVIAARTHSTFGELIRARNIISMLAAPLASGGKLIAVVTLCSSRAYTEEDLELIEELANHASLAIHNSRLIEESRRQLVELRKTEEQFRQAQKMEAVGRLAGGIAHDFNNLLTVIVNAASVLLEDVEAPASRGDIEDIQAAAERAADLTRQLLAFSRQQVLELKLLDLNAIVAKTQKMIARVVGEDIALHVVLEPSLHTIKSDPGLINQVLMNLVVNARDAMPGGGSLTIETRNRGDEVTLAISDTGTGMDEATKSRIFEPFFTTKDKSKGTGLGLSTVFGIVEQSGGRMEVESSVGHGATFVVVLPRTTEVFAVEAPGDQRLLRGGETIMLVEDDAQVRKVATAILQRSGYRVISAQSGPEALELYRGRLTEVDMLLSDVVMPAMSGRELADHLTAIRPDLRVLYMSGYTDDAIVHHRVLDPGILLVAKPFTKASLLDRVREVLARSG